MEATLNRLVEGMKDAHGANLVAIVLYGSAASGEFHEKFSDLNILCVLKEISVDILKKAEKIVTWFVGRGNPPPMYFTQEEIEHSHDVFPIEFLDIQVSHRLLWGRDIFDGLKIVTENHRLELEHELRTKFIGIRQNYLTISQDGRAVADLILGSISAFITLFRHALILTEEAVPVQKRDIIELIGARVNMDTTFFSNLLKMRQEGRRIPTADAEPMFRQYYDEISKLIGWVNRLPKK